MTTVFLSGVGGSTNWLPLVFPLAGAAVIIYLINVTIVFFKKRKTNKRLQNTPTSDGNSSLDALTE